MDISKPLSNRKMDVLDPEVPVMDASQSPEYPESLTPPSTPSLLPGKGLGFNGAMQVYTCMSVPADLYLRFCMCRTSSPSIISVHPWSNVEEGPS